VAKRVIRLINPTSGHALERRDGGLVDPDGNRFPIKAGIPRICEEENYSGSFGLQWNLFERTQLDRPENGLRASEARFFAETNWTPESLEAADILEVGSGAGRFSRVVLEHTGATLWSVDYSSAVEANRRNNGGLAPDRFHLFQASIYELPFPDDSFDRIFCLGVLQHTPDFEKSVAALVSKAKPGAEIVVDFYPIRGWWTKLHAKYLLRPITRRMPHDRLLKLIARNVKWLMAVSKGLNQIGLGALTRFLPLIDLRIYPRELAPNELREWAILDTFDMLSPAHDHPQRISAVSQMFDRHGADVRFAGVVEAGTGQAAVIRAVKRGAL
jgi:SAM-dependent methyltransferase